MGGRPKIKKVKRADKYAKEESSDKPKISTELKKKAKRKLAKIAQTEVVPSIKPKNALDYLKSWSTKDTEDDQGDNWKFKKTQHVWLLRNWKKLDLFDASDFELFIKYMRKDSSKGKQKLIEEAQKLIDDSDTSESADEVLVQRARDLIQST